MMIQKLTCVKVSRETLSYCDSCFKEKITRYTTQRNWSKEFFDNVKKNLTKLILKKPPAFIFVLVFMKTLLKVPCTGKVTSSNVKMNLAVVV